VYTPRRHLITPRIQHDRPPDRVERLEFDSVFVSSALPFVVEFLKF